MKEYSLVIASNFLDHYMFALSLELQKYFKDFYFVASKELDNNYKKIGFSDLNNKDFVIKAYEDKKKAEQVILNADVVITGSYVYEYQINKRIKNNKLVIYYSERLFKYNPILNLVSAIINIVRYRNSKNCLLLCISAYAKNDYAKIGLFKDRAYKWGYFPKVKRYGDVSKMISNKKKNSLFWAGRMIEWKHPDYAIKVAKRLKDEGYSFEMNIAGNGQLENALKEMIEKNELGDCVHMIGSMPPEEIRKNMEESEIYLFTSDKGEGWGVVLNEAMNSACACIASYSAGSTPFLINDGINGAIYKEDDLNSLYEKVASLLNDDKAKANYAKNAYETITEEWNSEETAKRIYEMMIKYFNNEDIEIYDQGLLSKASIL